MASPASGAHMGNGFATQVGSAPVSQQQQSKQIDTIAKKASSHVEFKIIRDVAHVGEV